MRRITRARSRAEGEKKALRREYAARAEQEHSIPISMGWELGFEGVPAQRQRQQQKVSKNVFRGKITTSEVRAK